MKAQTTKKVQIQLSTIEASRINKRVDEILESVIHGGHRKALAQNLRRELLTKDNTLKIINDNTYHVYDMLEAVNCSTSTRIVQLFQDNLDA